MSCYEKFAGVYDLFMKDIPYETWAEYIAAAFSSRLPPKEKHIIADLACGTGNMTMLLAGKGFDMIGVDRSADMLSEAREKSARKNLDILFLAQDVRKLDLFGTIDGAVSVCDGLNYILTEAELFAAFSRCALFLNTGGIFIFDMNTEYKFNHKLGDNTFTDTQGDVSYIWKNSYDSAASINEYRLFITAPEGSFNEIHHQRAYPADVVEGLLKDAGFTAVQTNDAYTRNPARPDSPRISFMAAKM